MKINIFTKQIPLPLTVVEIKETNNALLAEARSTGSKQMRCYIEYNQTLLRSLLNDKNNRF